MPTLNIRLRELHPAGDTFEEFPVETLGKLLELEDDWPE